MYQIPAHKGNRAAGWMGLCWTQNLDISSIQRPQEVIASPTALVAGWLVSWFWFWFDLGWILFVLFEIEFHPIVQAGLELTV